MILTQDRSDRLVAHLCRTYKVACFDLSASNLQPLVDLAGIGAYVRPEVLSSIDDLVPIAGLSLGPVILVKPGLDPTSRAKVVVHEVTHSLHVRREGILRYAALYVEQPEFRAAAEAAAYCAEAQLGHWLGEGVPAVGALVRIDHGYLLSGEQVVFGSLLGEQDAVAIEHGMYTQPVARAAIEWLEANPS